MADGPEPISDEELDAILTSATPEEQVWLDQMKRDFAQAFAEARPDRARREPETDDLPEGPPADAEHVALLRPPDEPTTSED